MKTMATVLLATLCAAPAAACDRVDAVTLEQAISELGATWTEAGGAVRLEWGRAWDGAAPRQQRLALLRAFADADACLGGRARPISFYRNDRLVGWAAPGSGAQLLAEPARVTTGAPAVCP